MRWSKPVTGTRIIKFFAWLPVSIRTFDGKVWHKETRWWERVKIEQRWVPDHVSILGEFSHSYWEDIKFIE